MNKENNKSAAGLRRSAIAERIRLQEEWSALKGPEVQKDNVKQHTNILTKKQTNIKTKMNVAKKESTRKMQLINDTLRGVVALVEVDTECRALPLRAALSALGASVLPSWSPLVTHLVWSQGGCRSTRAKARALACRLVSPLWVEACAAASARLPEHSFPAAARASDLPSPRTLRRLLKKAEMENIPITELLSMSNEEKQNMPRLRISSETERDTSTDVTDTSRDTSNTTNDTSTDIETRVNTAPRRALPKTSSVSPTRPAKSRRKLFTQKEAEITKDNDDSDDGTITAKPRKPSLIKKPTATVHQQKPQTNRRELARAERMARKLVAGCTPKGVPNTTRQEVTPRIVLTGMLRSERRVAIEAIKSLKGRVQNEVDRRTTHVVLGSCNRGEDNRTELIGSATPPGEASAAQWAGAKPRTAAALRGAARGCRVLRARWLHHCAAAGKWLHHAGYEVPHLRKISQKARVERAALGKLRSEYAYDVFSGMRVRMARGAPQRDAARALLALCGAVVLGEGTENDGVQNGGPTQNGGRTQPGGLTQNGGRTLLTQYRGTQCQNDGEYDIVIGSANGEISSKWVFDSVAAGRMRTTRRYVINSLSDSELVSQMERFQC